MVGATGVEPARISPKDPKSFASANSATRPTIIPYQNKGFERKLKKEFDAVLEIVLELGYECYRNRKQCIH